MFHLHRFNVVRRSGPNTYEQCRCQQRRIIQRDRGRPVDRSWVERGTFREMPTRGPGPAGVSTR